MSIFISLPTGAKYSFDINVYTILQDVWDDVVRTYQGGIMTYQESDLIDLSLSLADLGIGNECTIIVREKNNAYMFKNKMKDEIIIFDIDDQEIYYIDIDEAFNVSVDNDTLVPLGDNGYIVRNYGDDNIKYELVDKHILYEYYMNEVSEYHAINEFTISVDDEYHYDTIKKLSQTYPYLSISVNYV